MTATRIMNKSSFSCGCLNPAGGKKTHATPQVVNELIGWYIYGASQRDLVFALTHEQCFALFVRKCTYCGILPYTVKKHKLGAFLYNGIDRVDNQKGYTLENSVPCCKTCNLAKHKLSLSEFKAWIQRIAYHNYGE
jgi:5-methylcytosine-specific restriction endonuclease McrA